MPLQLNPYETLMAQKAEAAELCDFTEAQFREQNRPEIRAEAIRALLLGIPVRYYGANEDRVVTILGPGLRLKKPDPLDLDGGIEVLQAKITGTLDLDHACREDNTPLPNLALYSCEFEEAILLDHTRMRSLILADSRLKHIHAPHAVFEGGVDISGIRSSEMTGEETGLDGQGQCWANFTGAKIGAAFYARGARLVAPAKRSPIELAVELPRYALQLDHSRIEGSLDLRQSFHAHGGLTIDVAHIGGHVRGHGVCLTSGEGAAFFAQHAKVGGDLDLSPQSLADANTDISRLTGNMDISGMKLGGQLMLHATRINGDLVAAEAVIDTDAYMTARICKIAGQDELLPFEAKDVNFFAAKIAGALLMAGANLEGDLNAHSAQIGGGVNLFAMSGPVSGFEDIICFVAKNVYLGEARIGGHLAVRGAKLEGSLIAHNADIAGNVSLSQFEGKRNGQEDIALFEAKDVIFFAAKIAGVLGVEGARLRGSLNAHSAKIGGVISLVSATGAINGSRETIRFEAKSIVLGEARIVGNLYVAGAKLEGDFIAHNAVISGDIYLAQFEGAKDGQDETVLFEVANVNLFAAKIAGNIVIHGAQISGGMLAKQADVGGDLNFHAYMDGMAAGNAETFPVCVKGVVNISGVTIRGDINLKGARLEGGLEAANADIGGNVNLSREIGRIAGKKHNFNFVSHKTVNFLGARIGQDFNLKGARLAKRPQLKNLRVSGSLTGVGWFSYGRRPEIAQSLLIVSVTLFLFWIVGWFGVLWADQGPEAISFNSSGFHRPFQFTLLPTPVMVVDNGSVSTIDDTTLNSFSVGKNVLAPGEHPCGNQIQPSLYAFDLLIPLLDLHQEHRCAVSRSPHAMTWRILGALYILAGWVLISWFIFHVSGLMLSGPGAGRSRE